MKTLLVALLLLVIGTGTAFAACAWVVGFQAWGTARSGEWIAPGKWTAYDGLFFPTHAACQARITAVTGIPERGSLGDWLDWMGSRGQYAHRSGRQPKPLYFEQDASTAMILDGYDSRSRSGYAVALLPRHPSAGGWGAMSEVAKPRSREEDDDA
jgi:hypothetical protein